MVQESLIWWMKSCANRRSNHLQEVKKESRFDRRPVIYRQQEGRPICAGQPLQLNEGPSDTQRPIMTIHKIGHALSIEMKIVGEVENAPQSVLYWSGRLVKNLFVVWL